MNKCKNIFSLALKIAFRHPSVMDLRVLRSRKYMLSFNYIPAGI